MSRRLPPAEIIDAEFVVVRPRFRISWWAVFWWCFYTATFAAVGRDAHLQQSEEGVVLMVVAAALIVPGGRLVTWFLRSLGSKVSEDEADRLRGDILGDPRRRRR